MKRAIPVVLALVALAAVYWYLRGREPAPPEHAAAPAVPAPAPPPPRPDGDRAQPERGSAPRDLAVLMDDDPEGTLRLEGLVLGADDKPVAAADVTVSSEPPRVVTTDDDGSFHVDRLVGRPYTLVARAAAGVAGPVTSRLTATSDPVILHLRPAATVEVTVTSVDEKRALGGATVELRSLATETGTTDAEGLARFPGVPGGGLQIVASAPGHAPTAIFTRVPSGEATIRESVALRRGAAVAGLVVDDHGSPVAGARVVWSGASDWSQQADPRRDAAVTDDAGRFRFPALAAGSFRFVARHERFAPGRSELVTLDGKNERTGVEIRLQPAAVLAGKVVSAGGEPVGWAAVRVAQDLAGINFEDARQTFADEHGAFEMDGLPRGPIQVVAAADDASSETTKIDLTAKPEQRDVVLTLSIDGAIAGVVVDGKGEPVEGAQVTAFPNMRRGGGGGRDMMRGEWQLRGIPRELTDAGGRFALRGLRPGPYELRASPAGVASGFGGAAWLREGTDADTGDTNVKIVLAADGGVRGKVTFADGTAPDLFTVSAGFGPGSPYASPDGSFQLGDLPPGEYDLVVRGAGFDQKRVPGIKIVSDEVTDAGTITVAKGRTITGRVVDAGGAPIEGAHVLANRRLFGDGASSQAQFGGPPGARGARNATTDEQGEFTIYGVGERELILLAEHDTAGRSMPVRVPGGPTPVAGVEIRLAPYGALEGSVTKAGQPAEDVPVSCRSQTYPELTYGVGTGPDGKFRFDHLAPDTYVVSAMNGMNPMQGMGFYSKVVTVQSGAAAHVDLSLSAAPTVLAVQPVPDSGRLSMAFIWVVGGPIKSKVAKDLEREVAALGGVFSSFGISFGGMAKKVEGVEPGAYTACAVPFPSELRGPGQTMDYVEREGDNMPVYCVPVTVNAAPAEQSVSVPVKIPAFVPAPAPPEEHGSSG